MKCPGQDPRYWGDDAAFEVPCPKCGRSVEIFKDESSAKCSACEHRFRNPKLDLKCAEWCAYAKECLGFDVPTVKSANLGEGALAGRLIQVVKEEFAEDQSRITRTLMAFQHAKELASVEGGDARLVMAAVLLLEIGWRGSDEERNADETGSRVDPTPARARRILEEVGVVEPIAGQVCQILETCREVDWPPTIESRIVRDSYTLTDLGSRQTDAKVADIDDFIENQLATDAARRRARDLFSN